MTEITNSEVIKAWSAAYDHADTFGEEGDFAHQHLLNPAIFTKGERESPGIHAWG